MNISTNALVLRVKTCGESDRLCTLLTSELGVVRAFARCAKNIKNKNFAATCQLVYGRFTLYYGKERYIIDESSAERQFAPRLADIERLSLAQYLCELSGELAPSDQGSAAFLRLALGALELVAEKRRANGVVKAATELRMLSMAGYMPDLVMCSGCGAYEAPVMWFSPVGGFLRCSECKGESGDLLPLSAGALAAMRHCVYADFGKTFAFNLSEPSLSQLVVASERYLRAQLDKSFSTLEFYNTLLPQAKE